MGTKFLIFGTDTSPVLLDAKYRLIATLKHTLNGALRFKDAGSYNFSRNMGAHKNMAYYIDEQMDLYEFNLADLLVKEYSEEPEELDGKIIGSSIEEFYVEKKTGKVYTLTNNGVVWKYPTKLSNT